MVRQAGDQRRRRSLEKPRSHYERKGIGLGLCPVYIVREKGLVWALFLSCLHCERKGIGLGLCPVYIVREKGLVWALFLSCLHCERKGIGLGPVYVLFTL